MMVAKETPTMPAASDAYLPDPLTDSRLYDGVRTRRVLAFLFDVVIVAILTLLAAVLVFFLGIVTLGLGWLLYAILWPAVALVYCAFTLGGANSATPGMRAFGLEMRTLDGGTMNPVLAMLHSILFYASISLLTPLVLLVSLIADRKRLVQDLIIGTVVVNRR
jgi:uncharacterized RDD family membrane protein YckC